MLYTVILLLLGFTTHLPSSHLLPPQLLHLPLQSPQQFLHPPLQLPHPFCRHLHHGINAMNQIKGLPPSSSTPHLLPPQLLHLPLQSPFLPQQFLHPPLTHPFCRHLHHGIKLKAYLPHPLPPSSCISISASKNSIHSR